MRIDYYDSVTNSKRIMPRGGHREKAGRKSGWVNSETQLIRVPKVLVARLLEIAKHLDQGDGVNLVEREIFVEPGEALHSSELEAQLNIFSSNPDVVVDESPPPPLGLRALAKRLDVSSGTLSRHKKITAKSLAWMYEKDEKWGWFFNSKTEKFHPVSLSEFDHLLSEVNNENPVPLDKSRDVEYRTERSEGGYAAKALDGA